jgi:hypothetical protein
MALVELVLHLAFRSKAQSANILLPLGSSADNKSTSFVLRHPDFKKTEAKRPDFDAVKPINVVKSPDPNLKCGQGVHDNGASLEKKHIEIDAYAEGRPMMSHYKLPLSDIVPRAIGFPSTKSADGSTENWCQ